MSQLRLKFLSVNYNFGTVFDTTQHEIKIIRNMKVLKKIGIALLITIALIVAAVILTAPFALIENPLAKAIIAFVYLFGVVFAATWTCGDEPEDEDD